ncbi:MAG: alpha-D-ribose 1-methylphosphonate 5-triphosphate diphosphatase [Rhodosalinus sp.]
MRPLLLSGAEVLRDGRLAPGDLCVADGMILAEAPGDARCVDLTGFRVLPGIVDAHGDGFERHLAPRRGAMTDLGAGLAAAEADFAANGVTTAVLAQFWSWEGGMRGPDFARRLLTALETFDGGGTDLRAQLRFETHLLDDYAALDAAVAAHRVRYVVFNDHLPHDRLAEGRKPPRLAGQALKSGRSPEAHLALMQRLHARGPEVPAALDVLAARLSARDVLMGSHDDRTPGDRAAWRARGVRIAEFPETREAAAAAVAAGDPVVMGAPNIVRDGSHDGKVAAEELVDEGLVTALASDYHVPSLCEAALELAPRLGFAAAWALISERPAAMLGLADRGRLEPGLRADLLVLDASGRVGATFAAGVPRYMAGAVAARFLD